MISTGRLCAATQNELEVRVQTVLDSESTVLLRNDRKLTLDSGEFVLVFRQVDWVD